MCNDRSFLTAVSGEDYKAYNGTIQFGKCDARKCVNIAIINDLIVEKLEYFKVILNMNTSGLELSPMAGTVRIYSDERKNPADIIVILTLFND